MKVIDSATRSAERDTLSLPEAKLEEWNIATDTPAAAPILLTKPAGADQNVVPIELFSPDAMMRFNRALTRGAAGRPVRIAVLGDSFIEGDIITADLREQLQNLCGGRGVGFVPFASPLAKFRGTVLHSFSNWDIYNIRDRAQIPAAIKDRFFVSGFVCIPQEGATTRLQGVTFRKHINQAGTARLVFTNRNNTRLNVVINDSVSRLFAPEPSEHVQQIVINAPVHSISVTLNRTDGFTGYGIVLEDAGGVSVDNYSIRGNSGMALFETNSFVNQQIGQMLGYDLIVLQYGLNVMSPDVLKYDSYSKTFTRIIRYVQQCFPGASILVMGVGDRSTLRDGQFVTMPAVKGMIDAQRKAAEAAGVAFWNTFDAMGGENSMVNFVQKRSGPRKTIRISVIRAANISRSVLLPRSYTTRSSTPATATSRCRSTTAPRQIRAKTPSRPDGNTKGRNRIRLKAAQKRRQEPQQRTGNAAKRIKIQQGTVTGNGPEPELKPGQKRVQVPER